MWMVAAQKDETAGDFTSAARKFVWEISFRKHVPESEDEIKRASADRERCLHEAKKAKRKALKKHLRTEK